ncbi:recombinase family protein [Methylorubrum extorquens]|uniref:recombinase family protein n=1 Tax=Methylorubrum extorquens TaxID=408 RepID=UPI0022387DE4|nr:recombinase family protein [Methylorubrum extorquens]UYW30273.1 recombinase family protein [Methylorubrum extorquens]
MSGGSFVAYYRVSTKRQGASGLGLEAQQEAVRGYVNGRAWKLVEEVIEVESGKRSDRPKLAEALRLCRLQKATLVIAKLDRLARNVAFVSTLMESGADFVAVDFPQANRLTVHILAAVAEHEAAAISQRTSAALRQAKARGVKLGGDRGHLSLVAAQGHAASLMSRRAKASARAADLRPIVTEIRMSGAITLQAIADALNARGIPAARGGRWSSAQVRRLETERCLGS